MKITTLIPHYRNGKITAYSVSQFLKYSEGHENHIIISNNSPYDDSIKYLEPFKDKITIIDYPSDRLQSHGIAADYILELGLVETDHFVFAESDAFPTDPKFYDYYEELAGAGADLAGSILSLSGGQYIHPCFALYSKRSWQECALYCARIEYSYFPNMSMKEGFQSHLMVHDRILDEFLDNPAKYITLSSSYEPFDRKRAISRREHYRPTVGPFHNGMGMVDESVKTYGSRSLQSEIPTVLLTNDVPIINRVGYEPGQFFSYWALATGKKVFQINTEVKWMVNRQFQQQEYTLTVNGGKHLWGGSAWYKSEAKDMQDVIDFKARQIDQLYDSMPNNFKI